MSHVRLVSQPCEGLADVLDYGCRGRSASSAATAAYVAAASRDGFVHVIGVEGAGNALHVGAVATVGFNNPFGFELSEGSSDGARSESQVRRQLTDCRQTAAKGECSGGYEPADGQAELFERERASPARATPGQYDLAKVSSGVNCPADAQIAMRSMRKGLRIRNGSQSRSASGRPSGSALTANRSGPQMARRALLGAPDRSLVCCRRSVRCRI